MLDKFLYFGLMFLRVFLLIEGGGGTIRVRAVLEGLLRLGLIMEVRRGDKSDDLFERVFWVFPDEEVYESGYATEQALKIAND